jgi:DNA repair exonuclease SbcCD nuclease subunit
MRFIHTADWQIGMKAAHVGAVGARVRQERLDCARRVVQAASNHDCDFMLVAGDTFEDNGVDRVLVQKVADILAGFTGPVYLMPGNHDPWVPGAVWDHPAWRSHDNLTLLWKQEAVTVPGGVLYACPLFEKHSPRDPTSWINANDAEAIAIAIAHGSVEGVVQDELDYPIARTAATYTGLDYLALGHWHSTATYPDSTGAVRMAYSGTHETTKFGERDSGNVLVVEIAQRGAVPEVTPVRTGGLVWRTIEEDVRGPGDLTRVRQSIESLQDPQSTLLELHLSGILHAAEQSELTRIEEIFAAERFVFGRIDHSRLFPQPEDEGWITSLPVGPLQEAAKHLRGLSNRAVAEGRPDYASPEVATRALLELFTLVTEVQS